MSGIRGLPTCIYTHYPLHARVVLRFYRMKHKDGEQVPSGHRVSTIKKNGKKKKKGKKRRKRRRRRRKGREKMKSYSLSLVGSKPRANLSATYFYSFCRQPTVICIRQFSDWSLKIFMADRDMEEISNGNWDVASSFDFHFRFLIQIFNLRFGF